MDHAPSAGMNGSHVPQSQNSNAFSTFIDDVHSYANGNNASAGNAQIDFPWDAALFSDGDLGTSYHHQQPQQPQQSQQSQQQQPQQQQRASSHFNQPLQRQTSSPGLPQYASTQSTYSPHNFAHQMYEPRSMAQQPSYDERFMMRGSGSNSPFDPYTAYQQQHLNYGGQSYPQLNPQYQPRQSSSTPTPSYAQQPSQQQQQPQPQQHHQYMNIAARPPSQLSHAQGIDPMRYTQFQNSQQMSHTFVNPSMLSANSVMDMNGSYQKLQQPSKDQTAPVSKTNVHQQHHQQSQPQFQHSQYYPKSAAGDMQGFHVFQTQQMPITTMGTPQPQLNQTNIQPQTQTQITQQVLAKPKRIKAPKDPNAPKKVRQPKAKLQGEPAGGSDTESSDDLEIEDEPPETAPALLVVNPPTDVAGKAMYNAVKAVWSPRNKVASPEKVRSGIAEFGDAVRALRDAWKAKNENLKKAELPKSDTAAEATRLKEDVARLRQSMETLVLRSLQFGHEAVVRRLAENQFTLSALYSFLLDRASAGDYESSLVSSIFKFAIKFETLDEEMLETVKWSKVLQRFTKKATNESKGLAQKILSNATVASAKKKNAKTLDGPASPASANGSLTGVKRSRDGETGPGPVPKKTMVRPASKPLALQHAERRKAQEKEQRESAAKKDEKTGATSTRSKIAMTAPPKANAFASLLSASKKPGTSLAEKAAAAAKEKTTSIVAGPVAVVKKEEPKKESPPRVLGPLASSKSASSFLGYLADMDKPKQVETKKVEETPNETDEQRAKRERKEKRRRLRVTWKADDELVETRLFTHDLDEETGHADSMMRDAGDTAKEGEMLKLHKGAELDDEDDEEDDSAVNDLTEYSPLTEVDFSPIESEITLNFVKFGGSNQPESASNEAQSKREENTLMAIYTLKSDRPDTPKEAPSEDEDDFSPSVDFGEPSELVKRREKEILARKQQPSVPDVKPNSMDLASQLRAITQQQTQSQAQTGLYTTDLQRTLGLFGQQQAPQTSAPPTQASGQVDLSKLMTIIQQVQQNQNPYQAQAPSAAPPAAAAPVTPGVPANLAALVAQVTGNQSSQSLPVGTGSNPNPFPGNEFNDRKHPRTENAQDSGRKKKKVPERADGKPINYKTEQCMYYKSGKCTKGDNCTYRHDE